MSEVYCSEIPGHTGETAKLRFGNLSDRFIVTVLSGKRAPCFWIALQARSRLTGFKASEKSSKSHHPDAKRQWLILFEVVKKGFEQDQT